MRNQTWNQKGAIIRDIELYLEGNILKAKDVLTGKVRDAIDEEKEQFFYKPPRDLEAEIVEIKAALVDHDNRLKTNISGHSR